MSAEPRFCAFCKARMFRRQTEAARDWRRRKCCDKSCAASWLAEKSRLVQEDDAAPAMSFAAHNLHFRPSYGRLPRPDPAVSLSGSSAALLVRGGA